MREAQAGKSHDYRGVSFSKSSVFKMFAVHGSAKLACVQPPLPLQNLPDFFLREGAALHRPSKAGVFKKLRFHDGLVWTEGLTVDVKLRFQISWP